LASDNDTAQSALADLLLGFGYPTGGECFVQGIPLSKLGVDQMGELACWVAPDGPLFTASVDENLRTIASPQVKAVDLTRVLNAAKCDGAVNALQDGVATLISPGDDRLSGDVPFRLGIARALTLKKPIVVIHEPPPSDDQQMENETRETIEHLAANNFIVILIPSRSKTLWSAHQVLFLQNGRLIASGKHSHLLEQNDAYRHWNYMRFSPYLTRSIRY
jgi:ATP-binding cassette subfamily B protein